MYKTIDIETWQRKDLFLFFKKYDNPTWDIIADLRIENFYNKIKEINASFYFSFLHVATKVCNSIDAFRLRIDDEGNVREYEIVHPGSTILYDNGTFGFGYYRYHPDLLIFNKEAEISFRDQKERMNLDPKDDDLARLYFSPIPWLSFTGFRHPYRNDANHSIPMIVFGKHHENDGTRVMPLGLTLHHGLADGYHAGLFFNRLQDELNAL